MCYAISDHLLPMKLARVEARRSKRKKKRKVSFSVELSRQDVEYLRKNTRFDEDEIQDWYRYNLQILQI